MSQIHLETYTMLETENLNTKFQPIRMKELSVIAIYTQIASGHILLTVRSCASVAIFFLFEKAPPFFFTCLMTMLWRISGVHFVHFEAGISVKNIIFRLGPLKVKGHFEVRSHLWLICQWLNNSEHFWRLLQPSKCFRTEDMTV